MHINADTIVVVYLCKSMKLAFVNTRTSESVEREREREREREMTS